MSHRYQTILLFGAPGAGKGTQGKILGQIPGFYHLSCGEVFRTLDVSSRLGRIFQEYSSRGELVPDDVTVEMWCENMRARTVLSEYKPHVDLLVLDGIPRNVRQAKLLSKYIHVLEVVHLVCPDKEAMIQRLRRRALKENRVDDAKEDVIRRRWAVYENETAPVLAYYNPSIVRTVDAMGSPASVLQHILEVVVPVQESHFRNPLTAAPSESGVKAKAARNGKAAPRKSAANRAARGGVANKR
ncbi:MAG: nucleoside monophosphate kinase [Phycisphaeraceae bacterium]|nr:nucleoside monophosphate kinase [Phycisphaerae bacterium]MBX3391118.1 nucleoside monophosphate kinase [Phycisphaeraceae bacterium]HRJ49837.1 nucleoside monophosphate kinase [Phycisphaerales bacterium]